MKFCGRLAVRRSFEKETEHWVKGKDGSGPPNDLIPLYQSPGMWGFRQFSAENQKSDTHVLWPFIHGRLEDRSAVLSRALCFPFCPPHTASFPVLLLQSGVRTHWWCRRVPRPSVFWCVSLLFCRVVLLMPNLTADIFFKVTSLCPVSPAHSVWFRWPVSRSSSPPCLFPYGLVTVYDQCHYGSWHAQA